MIKGTTQTGFNFEISQDVLDDWEILEIIDEVDENPQKIVRLAKKLLGEPEYKKLKSHCEVDGKVKMSTMMSEVQDIMTSSQETKN